MNLLEINRLTPILWDIGVRVLQIYRFAKTDFEHIRRLLIWMEPPLNAKIIDLGCGVGEVSNVMNFIRPDLTFTLVNISKVQLEYCNKDTDICLSSFLSVPRKSSTYDCASFMFSVGHEDLRESIKEAYRLLKIGGVLFIFDMVRISGSNADMNRIVSYNVINENNFRSVVNSAGFHEDFCMKPKSVNNIGIEVCGSKEAYEEVFSGVDPVVWRFIKQ